MVGDGSVFTDAALWTLANAEAVDRAFVQRPDDTDEKFLDKLQRQMSDAPGAAQQLMAEMLWITLLFPASDTIGAETKRRQITTIWNLSGAPLPENHPMLSDQVLDGIGSAGQGFNNYRWKELVFLVKLTIEIKKLSRSERARVFDDYDRYIEFVSERRDQGHRQLRHILRFFAFPDRVEPMSANSERRAVLAAFRGSPEWELRKWSHRQLDDELLKLRRELEAKQPGAVVDFYRSPWREKWARDAADASRSEFDFDEETRAEMWAAFLRDYPDFVDFGRPGEKFERAEIAYKRHGLVKFAELGGRDKVKQLLAIGDATAAIGLVQKSVSLNIASFQSWRPSIGIDRPDALKDVLTAFVHATEVPYAGPETLQPVFDAMTRHGLRPAWDTLSVLLWGLRPTDYFPIKISYYRDLAEALGHPLDAGRPTPSNFDQLVRFAKAIWQVAASRSPRDWVDVQSFLWSLCQAYSKPADHDAAEPSRRTKIWAIAPGENGRLRDEFHAEGIIGIGWDDLGDLTQYKSRDELEKALRGDDDRRRSNDSLCCWQFAHDVQPGDLMIVKRGRSTVMGLGRVISEYMYRPDREEYHHIRKLEWLRTGSWDVGDTMATKTLTNVTPYPEWIRQVLETMGEHALWREWSGEGAAAADPEAKAVAEQAGGLASTPYTIDDGLKELFAPREKIDQVLGQLRRKKNIVLQGPPGVGKTFAARRLAFLLLGERDASRIELVQFHPNTSYEDFVLGLRPDGTGGFELKPGVFHRFCTRAQKDSSRPYVFIIDEINRGNLAKILGELMMLIESDKRGPEHAVHLAYARETDARLYLPANLYVIGTMNTADRSLALVDYALRRRFAFLTLEPNFGARFRAELETTHGRPPELVEKIVRRVGALNQAICADVRGLGPGYQIGHSFFCNGNEAKDHETWYADVVNFELRPLLEEYWMDDPKKADDAVKALLA